MWWFQYLPCQLVYDIIASQSLIAAPTHHVASFAYLNFFQFNSLLIEHVSILDVLFLNSNLLCVSKAALSDVYPDKNHPLFNILHYFQSNCCNSQSPIFSRWIKFNHLNDTPILRLVLFCGLEIFIFHPWLWSTTLTLLYLKHWDIVYSHTKMFITASSNSFLYFSLFRSVFEYGRAYTEYISLVNFLYVKMEYPCKNYSQWCY